jgi:alkylated DNA nucleotide flippase Atl1
VVHLVNLRVLGASALILSTVACGGTVVSELTGPDVVRCQTTLAAPQSPVPSNGAQLSAAVGAARECSWTASSEAPWIRVSPSSGQGEATLTLVVESNGTAIARSGTIVLNDSRHTLAQEAAPCRYELNRGTAVVPHTGGSTSVGLSTLEGCAWNASTSAPWVRVVNPSGRNSAIVEFEVSANTGTARTAEAIVAGLRFVIQQDVPPPVQPPPAPPSPTPPPTPPPAPPGPPPTPPPNPPPPTTPPPTVPPTVPPPTPPVPTPPVPTPPAPPAGREFEAEGRISNFSGECPRVTFELRGVQIVTDRNTRFENGSCNSLRDRRRVEVKGVYTSNGTVLAERVKREDDDDDDDEP